MDRLNKFPDSGDSVAPPTGAPTKARLKWFNGPKGFGFVVPEDRPDTDAFLHITTLQKANVQSIGDNACFLCHIQYGPKGAHVTHIVDMLEKGTSPKAVQQPESHDSAAARTQKMDGTVKWYNTEKEFGFVIPDDGKKDVFIHRTCLEKNGLRELIPGQRVRMSFRDVPKGREVVTLTVLADGA